MNHVIPSDYKMKTYGTPANSRTLTPFGTQTGSFLEMAAQTGQAKALADAMAKSASNASAFGITGMGAAVQSASSNPAAVSAAQSAKTSQTQCVNGANAPSLETMLKEKYPGLVYHVFDASSSYWKTRNDYPHYLLYQSGDKAAETLENWQPTGENPFYGSIDGKFIAPAEIHALGKVPPGSKAVVIHPKVQERMEQDPEYANEIMARIDTWFAFDVARNEAIMPGSTFGMSQAVAIGEDGTICNAVSSSSGGELTQSSDEMVRAYYLRMAKRADFMRWLNKKQLEDTIQDSLDLSKLAAAAAAKSRLAEMMDDDRLSEIFGDEIAGVPTETVLAITREQVWGIQGTL